MNTLQFNLLPDVKMAYVRAARTRNLVLTLSFLIGGGAVILLLIMLFVVDVVQKKQLSSADNSVKKYTTQLESVTNVNKILTVQNQLKTLVGLHQQKHATSRTFTYLPEVTPTNVHIGQIALDFTTGSLTLTGTSDSQHSINTFIDTLKFTTYQVGSDPTQKTAFPSVVETSFGLDPTIGATYTITVQFDPVLFANNLGGKVPVLNVPKLTSTRSVVEDPSNILFNGQGKPSTSTPKGNQ